MSNQGSSCPPSKGMDGLVAAVAAAIQHDASNTRGHGGCVVTDGKGTTYESKRAVRQDKILPSKRSNQSKPSKDVAQARARRLEQNRRAAIESRRRKKVMIEELQRSVTFYTKANANLKLQNMELEQKILFAKQQSNQTGPTLSQDELCYQEQVGMGAFDPLKETSERGVSCLREDLQYNGDVGAVHSQRRLVDDNAETLVPLEARSSDVGQEEAQFIATQALYNTRGYPPGAARIAASTFSQFVGQTGVTPAMPEASKVSVTPEIAAVSTHSPLIKPNLKQPNEEPSLKPLAQEVDVDLEISTSDNANEVGVDSDAYVRALNEFAMQQAAAANAAAAAANAAIQAANLHKLMLAKGERPKIPSVYPFQPTQQLPRVANSSLHPPPSKPYSHASDATSPQN